MPLSVFPIKTQGYQASYRMSQRIFALHTDEESHPRGCQCPLFLLHSPT